MAAKKKATRKAEKPCNPQPTMLELKAMAFDQICILEQAQKRLADIQRAIIAQGKATK